MTGIVLQARMGSTRLPGKVLMPLCGRPMLGHILDRLKTVGNADIVIVATTTQPADDAIESFVRDEGVAFFRGDEADVLNRYWRASEFFGLDQIVRATADNPFVDPTEIKRLIELHVSTSADFSHALGQLPLGVGTECFTRAALERSWREGTLSHHREHVDEYILEHPELFHIEQLLVVPEKIAPTLSLTVDTPADFTRATLIYDALYRPSKNIGTEDAIRICASLSA
jgi:spore coat polysaccharide biosynthesis protein SpsF